MKNMADADVVRKLRAEIEKAGSQSEWARRNRFSRSFICDVLAGSREVTERLAAALGFKKAAGWERAESC